MPSHVLLKDHPTSSKQDAVCFLRPVLRGTPGSASSSHAVSSSRSWNRFTVVLTCGAVTMLVMHCAGMQKLEMLCQVAMYDVNQRMSGERLRRFRLLLHMMMRQFLPRQLGPCTTHTDRLDQTQLCTR